MTRKINIHLIWNMEDSIDSVNIKHNNTTHNYIFWSLVSRASFQFQFLISFNLLCVCIGGMCVYIWIYDKQKHESYSVFFISFQITHILRNHCIVHIDYVLISFVWYDSARIRFENYVSIVNSMNVCDIRRKKRRVCVKWSVYKTLCRILHSMLPFTTKHAHCT